MPSVPEGPLTVLGMLDGDRRKRDTTKAQEARASMDQSSVLGRSEGVYTVLRLLENGEVWPSDRISEEVSMKRNNTNRILLSLMRHFQVKRVDDGKYAHEETEEGYMRPSRQTYVYRITDKGRGRLKWLRENKPWEV